MSTRARDLGALPVLGVTRSTPEVVRKPVDGIIVLYPASPVELRDATPADAPVIHGLLQNWVQEGRLLPRTLEQVYRSIRDFTVAVHEGQIVGCAALRVYSESLGEVSALAVAAEWQGRGVGRRIVEALVDEARELGMQRVFALTMEEAFFHRAGFRTVRVAEFPDKIAQDCRTCERRSRCVEIAVAMDLDPKWD